MGIGHSGAKSSGYKLAHTRRGLCKICQRLVLPGQYYIEGVGRTNTRCMGIAHKDCSSGMGILAGSEDRS